MMVALKTPVGEGDPPHAAGEPPGLVPGGAGGKRATIIAGTRDSPESGDGSFFYARASVNARTSFAPASTRTRAHSRTVAPVVLTSSIRTSVFPSIFRRRFTA